MKLSSALYFGLLPAVVATNTYSDFSKSLGVKSFYDVLEQPNFASAADCSKAFKKLALAAHPDKGGATEKFQQLSTVKEFLNAEGKKKATYDLYLALDDGVKDRLASEGRDNIQMWEASPLSEKFSKDKLPSSYDELTNVLHANEEDESMEEQAWEQRRTRSEQPSRAPHGPDFFKHMRAPSAWPAFHHFHHAVDPMFDMAPEMDMFFADLMGHLHATDMQIEAEMDNLVAFLKTDEGKAQLKKEIDEYGLEGFTPESLLAMLQEARALKNELPTIMMDVLPMMMPSPAAFPAALIDDMMQMPTMQAMQMPMMPNGFVTADTVPQNGMGQVTSHYEEYKDGKKVHSETRKQEFNKGEITKDEEETLTDKDHAAKRQKMGQMMPLTEGNRLTRNARRLGA